MEAQVQMASGASSRPMTQQERISALEAQVGALLQDLARAMRRLNALEAIVGVPNTQEQMLKEAMVRSGPAPTITGGVVGRIPGAVG